MKQVDWRVQRVWVAPAVCLPIVLRWIRRKLLYTSTTPGKLPTTGHSVMNLTQFKKPAKQGPCLCILLTISPTTRSPLIKTPVIYQPAIPASPIARNYSFNERWAPSAENGMRALLQGKLCDQPRLSRKVPKTNRSPKCCIWVINMPRIKLDSWQIRVRSRSHSH